MPRKVSAGRSGGVNISGRVGAVAGDIVGRDKITRNPPTARLENALRPLSEAIASAPAETRSEAETKLKALKTEMLKGKASDDGAVAGILDKLTDLVPSAADAVVSTFTTPILGKLTGPVTKFVLDKLRGKSA